MRPSGGGRGVPRPEVGIVGFVLLTVFLVGAFIATQIIGEWQAQLEAAEPITELTGPPLRPGYAAAMTALAGGVVTFYAGVLPIPIGWDRGKVRWVMWCGTGMHAHVVYWTGRGFQTLHPADRSEGDAA